jgi:hypothetical protein
MVTIPPLAIIALLAANATATRTPMYEQHVAQLRYAAFSGPLGPARPFGIGILTPEWQQ